MTALEIFHEDLDKSNYDIANRSFIIRKLQETIELLRKEGLTDLIELALLELYCYNLSKSLDLNKENNQPKGVNWQISGTIKTTGNEELPSIWPDINQFTESDFKHIEKRYLKTKNLFTKTEFGLIIYFQKSSAYARHNDFKKQLSLELFQLSQEYINKALTIVDKNYYTIYFRQPIKGALYIATQLKSDELKSSFFSWLQDLHYSWKLERHDAIRILSDITGIISDNFKNIKSEINIEAILQKNLEAVEILSKKDIWGGMEIVDITSKLDSKANLQYFDYKKRKAEFYEQLANEAENTPRQFVAIDFIEKALRLYKEKKDKVNIRRLEERYQKIRGTGYFSKISEEIDSKTVKIVLKKINEEIKEKESTEIIKSFSYLFPSTSYKVIEESAEQAMKDYVYLRMFGASIVDKYGNTIAKYSTEQEKRLYSFWKIYDVYFQTSIDFLVYYFRIAFKENKLNFTLINNFLKDSWVSEPISRENNGNRIEIYPIDILTPPIQLLFDEFGKWIKNESYQFNLIVVSDSLIMKIEALLRYMCIKIGVPTFKLKENGITMEKNLDEILSTIKDTVENPTGFDENDRLLIKFVLSEKMGLNLRNKIAHGLMDITEYNFYNVIISFAIILRLCSYNFISNQENKDIFIQKKAESI